MIATYVLDMFLSGINKDSSWGRLSRNAMFTFGDFTGIDTNRSAWNVYEIPFFLVRVLRFVCGFGWGVVALT